LEALATREQTQAILSAADKRWALREQTLKEGNLTIQWDKQGKHIEGHKNYELLKKRQNHPSIFKHNDPERLVRDHAGTGTKYNGEIPGLPGYVEVIDFNEFIGYAVDPFTGNATATTWGKIHYAQDGVHIVPTKPRG
jgi:hypothetical protein